MKLIVLLAGDYPDIAAEEALSVLFATRTSYVAELFYERLLRVAIPGESIDRALKALSHLVLAKEVVLELVQGHYSSLREIAERGALALKNMLERECTFAVRVLKIKPLTTVKSSVELEREIGEAILEVVGSKLKVDLRKPEVLVRAYIARDRLFLGLLVLRLRRSRLRERAPQRRPFFHPSALTPETARIMVNLSRVDEGIVLDPFCGTGSIPLEASSVGIFSIGVDIMREMVEGSKANSAFYGFGWCTDFVQADACALPFRDQSFDAIITDPPYGRLSPTGGRDPKSIYDCLAREARRVLKLGAACVYMHPHKLDPSCTLSLRFLSSILVHSDLTRILRVEVKEQ